jgi:ATP-dependent DNA helicase RecG
MGAPKLEGIGSHFRVTIANAQVRAASLDTIDRKITDLLRKAGALSTAAIARHAGLSQRATLTRLKSLKARGVLAEIGTGPHDPKRQYTLTERERSRW